LLVQAQTPSAITALLSFRDGAGVASPGELLALAELQTGYIHTGGLFLFGPSAHPLTQAVFRDANHVIKTKTVSSRSAFACQKMGLRQTYKGPTVLVGTEEELELMQSLLVAQSCESAKELLRNQRPAPTYQFLFGAFQNNVTNPFSSLTFWILRQIALQVGGGKTSSVTAAQGTASKFKQLHLCDFTPSQISNYIKKDYLFKNIPIHPDAFEGSLEMREVVRTLITELNIKPIRKDNL
jgi:hypothetical protein